MNPILTRWNSLSPVEAARQILPCCGSQAWATQLATNRPISTPEVLTATSDQIWINLPAEDQLEALATHPRIGERQAIATEKSLSWSAGEQAEVAEESANALAAANGLYDEKFERTFILCASGKTAPEILAVLYSRLTNTPEQELAEATEQQRQITNLRLHKWLEGR